MATSMEVERRIVELARQLSQEFAPQALAEGECLLSAIEEQAVQIGDALTRALVEQNWQVRAEHPQEAGCPNCGQRGRRVSVRERPLITRRGEATLHEAQYHCPCCRKDFFPDDRTARG